MVRQLIKTLSTMRRGTSAQRPTQNAARPATTRNTASPAKDTAMHRPLLIVAAFLLVTGGLILFQPKSTPTQAVEVVTSPPAPVAPPATEPAVVVEVAPQPVPVVEPDVTPIEVTRAAPLSIATDPAATVGAIGTGQVERDEMLFGRLTEERPNLLTATRRGPDGTLRPSLLQLGGVDITPQGAATPLNAPTTAASLTQTAPAAPAPSTPVATTPALSLEDLAATSELQDDLRTAVAAAPTQAVHTVRIGDSLTTLSLRYYQDASKADLIYEANRRVLTSRTLNVGQLLRIPDISNL